VWIKDLRPSPGCGTFEVEMKKFILQSVIIVTVLFVGLIYTSLNTPLLNNPLKVSKPAPVTPLRIIKVSINGNIFNVEVADTKERQAKGLGDRESLPIDSGMVFSFGTPGQHTFWMKGMKFPIDIIWINSGKIVKIDKNAQPPTPGQKDEDLERFSSGVNVTSVLEVNAGITDQLNIKEGDMVEVK
jgi:uncharacterized protein